MSVTVYSYVDDAVTASVQAQLAAQMSEKEKSVAETKTSSSESSASSAERIESFQSVLQDAERNVRAMAVDALVSLSQSGSVSTETIQRILGFNPAYASASSSQSTEEADSAEAEATAAATTASASTSSSAGGSLSCSAELEAYFTEAADTYGVDVNLLKSIAKVESNFNASATSSAGAMGIMQLMPSTASSLGVTDPYDAYENIMGGAKLISQNLEKYDGDVSLALAAYNAGSGNVDKYGGIPPFTETINYVDKVLGYYNEASGEAA